jgi:Transglutaminase-like superfamily
VSTPVVLPEPATLSTRERIAGHLAVVSARLLLALTRGQPTPLIRILSAGHGRRPGTVAAARRARAIVETVSPRCSSHHGCWPRSLAIWLMCRAHGQHVTWRVGVHSPPARTHAWIEVEGIPIGEPFDPHTLYTPMITV